MKRVHLRIIFAFVISISSINVEAQQIDEAALNLSDKKLVEGAFSVYLADTVSPGFIEHAFAERGIEIKSSHIQPKRVFFGEKPGEEIYRSMISHPYVADVRVSRIARGEEVKFPDDYTEEQKGRALKSLEKIHESSPFHIIFKHHVTQKMAEDYLSEFPGVRYAPIQPDSKYVTVTCEKGQEETLMKELEQLPYVESTAYIVASAES